MKSTPQILFTLVISIAAIINLLMVWIAPKGHDLNALGCIVLIISLTLTSCKKD